MKKLLIFIILIMAAVSFADEYTDTQAAAETAGVSKATAYDLAQRTRNKGYSQQTMAQIRSMISAGNGSSATRIAQKVMEGIAKNVPEANVLGAAKKVQARYSVAESIAKEAGVSKAAENRVTDMTADAMAAGAQKAGLDKAAEAIAGLKKDRDEYAVAVMSLYREMVRYGVTDAQASEVAETAAKKMSVSQINEYRMAFGQNAGSMGANAAASAMGQSMSKGYSASSMGSGSGSMGSGSGMGSGNGGSGNGGSGGHGGRH